MGVFQDARIGIAGLCLASVAIGFAGGREYEAEKFAETEAAQRLDRDNRVGGLLTQEITALDRADQELSRLEQRRAALPPGIQSLLPAMRSDINDLFQQHSLASDRLVKSGASAATSPTSRSEGAWYINLVEENRAIRDTDLGDTVTKFTLFWKLTVDARNARNNLSGFCLDLERSASGNKE